VDKALGNRRVTGKEQYYTPPELALSLTAELLSLKPELRSARFLEPAGGTGSFIQALTEHGVSSVVSVDTHPMHPKVSKQNFLEFTPEGDDYVTISNPPFGRNNALSVPFFNHAAKFSSHIAFLVPASWRKWSVTNRLDLNFHLVSDSDVSVIYQDAQGQDITQHDQLRTCFQIWERRPEPRKKVKVPESGLILRSNPSEANLAMRVFGYGCGKVINEFPRVKNTTMLYLKVQPGIDEILQGLDYERFSTKTAYTRALSLQEINYLLNEKLFGDGMKASS
jgi:predicted RNA methylase